MLRTLLFLAAISVATTSVASAQTVAQTMRDFGILGTWSKDCSTPASEKNFHTVFAALPSGKAKRSYYNGPNKVYNEFTITRAIPLPSNQLSYRQEGRQSKRLTHIDVILLKDGNRYSTWSSIGDDGKVYVKDGKFSDGKATWWEAKCSG